LRRCSPAAAAATTTTAIDNDDNNQTAQPRKPKHQEKTRQEKHAKSNLDVVLDALGHVEVHHAPDVPHVHAETERHRGHHHAGPAPHEGVLGLLPGAGLHAPMVRDGVVPVPLEKRAYRLGGDLAPDVDDYGALVQRGLPEEARQPASLVCWYTGRWWSNGGRQGERGPSIDQRAVYCVLSARVRSWGAMRECDVQQPRDSHAAGGRLYSMANGAWYILAMRARS